MDVFTDVNYLAKFASRVADLAPQWDSDSPRHSLIDKCLSFTIKLKTYIKK